MANRHLIIGIHVVNFTKTSGGVQQVLSEYGCSIRTRLGLHDVADAVCSPMGLILIEFIGSDEKAKEMTDKLIALGGLEIKSMTFDH